MGLRDRSGGGGDLAPAGLKTPRAAGVAGLLFAALFTASILITRSVAYPTTTGFYADVARLVGDDVSIVSAYLVPFAGIAFLWFIGVVRDRIGVYEDRFFSTVFLGSGVVFVALLFSAAAVLAALQLLSRPTDSTAELARLIGRAMFYMYGARAAGVFTLVTSTIALRTEATPKWAAFVGFAVGLVLLLTVQSFDMVILLFPAWVALVSVLMLVKAPPREAARD